MDSVVSVIGLLWCGIVGGLRFTLEMIVKAGIVSLFGAGLRIACSGCCVFGGCAG